MNKRLPVEAFIRELDLVSQSNHYANNEISYDDQRSFKLVQRLAVTDFSDDSLIRDKLRSQLTKRSLHPPFHRLYMSQFSASNNVRTLTGTGIAVIFIFVMIFGFLFPQHAPATPAVTGEIPSGLSLKPATSITAPVSHKQILTPKPIPTPLALTTFEGNSSSLLSSTPSRINNQMGVQSPISTITLSK